MKQVAIVLLMIGMLLSMCACGAPAEELPEVPAKLGAGLNAGYAKIDITPDYEVGIGGYSDAETRRSQKIADRLYATCIALTNEKDTVLLYTVDTCAVNQSQAEYFRVLITASTGVPGERIYLGATHCHSAPSIGDRYKTDLANWLVQAGRKAMTDRSPAKILAATPEIKGMNFVRHYEMADGTYAGSNFGDFSKKIVGHATESDPNAVLVKLDREEGRRDILLVNWQAHPDSTNEIGYYNLAASWVGPLRDQLEEMSGMEVAYFTGASGNQNPSSKIWHENHGLSWKRYGTYMARLLYKALPTLQEVEGSGIQTANQMVEVDINHEWDHMLDQANEVYDLWKTVGKAEGDALGRTYGFTSSYQARAIKSRAAMGKTTQLELNAFSVGGVGFTTGTYEMFSDQGLFVKQNSPYAITFIISGNSGYIPSKEAYEYRSYEADTGIYAPGTAEKLAEEYVRMLNALVNEEE